MQSTTLIGKIKKVTCKQFVTYEECTFSPGEHLNVVIGPNGTGKSTLVAAIVIGLGGDPKLLGRSPAIQDYIKSGKNSASIAVEIYKTQRGNTILFERSFNKAGKSEFKVDDQVVNKSKYLEAISFFKIQVGNLCQFLPQDKVQDFTKLNPQQLFSNTIKSVCDQNEIDAFDKLKDLRSRQSTGKENLQKDTQDLKNASARLDELKVSLERYTRRRNFSDKLQVCLAKQTWLEVEALSAKLSELMRDKTQAQKILQKTEKECNTIQRKQAIVAQTKTKLKADVDSKAAVVSSLLTETNTISTNIENCKSKIKTAKHDFETSKRNLSSARHEIQNENAILAAITQDMKKIKAELSSSQSLDSQLEEISIRIQNSKDEIGRKLKQRNDINNILDDQYAAPIQHLKSRIERANNVNNQKLQTLKVSFKDVFQAVEWLKDNKHLFQGKVYNPILLELNVKNPNHAKYVENSINIRDLLAFTCERKSDLSILVQELRVKQKLAINAAFSAPASQCDYQAEQPIETLRKYGFHSYLIDLIEGPPSILNHLCSLYKLHLIPIGDESVSQHTDRMPSNVRLYYGGNKRFNSSVSKYSGEVSLLQNTIDSKKLLHSVDMSQVLEWKKELLKLTRKTDELKNNRTAIERQIDEIQHQYVEIRNEKRKLEQHKFRIQDVMQKFKTQEQKIQKLQATLIDIPTAEKKYLTDAAKMTKNIIELLRRQVDTLSSLQKATYEKKYAEQKLIVYSHQSEDLETSLAEIVQRRNTCRETCNNIEKSLANSEKKYKDKKAQAKTNTNNCAPDDENFPYKKEFSELPNGLSELKDQINEYNARLECMNDTDENIVREYEEKLAETERLRNAIIEAETIEKDLQSDINSIFNSWYSNIERLIEVLNDQFSNFMASMRFVGEISLTRKDHYDFDSYGIQIMVQYRKEVPLQALDRCRQSGGERAVAIAVYTLALQHITHVPFRCVDEINQGMDSRNERKIFEMLVTETTKNGRSQYFFVTPKLLPGLSHNKRMTVHIVYNGKFVNQF